MNPKIGLEPNELIDLIEVFSFLKSPSTPNILLKILMMIKSEKNL